jgi:ribosomal protein S18 acetylase RimI-like enzyme
MDVRFLGPGDLDLLVGAVELSGGGPLSRERAAAHLADSDLVNVVAVEAGEPVGFIYGYVLRRFSKTSFFIYSVDVVKPFRRQGIAKAMLHALMQHAKIACWDEMFVFTSAGNVAAMALYSSAGGVRPNIDDVMFDFYT